METKTKVCVTGSSGYLGSWLVKRLLERGYTVHATLRNLGDASKVGLLKSLPGAEMELRLFEADIYSPSDYDRAIQGCEFVIHLATPVLRDFKEETQCKDISEVAVEGIKSIVDSCKRSGTVKRLIYTASVVAASPMRDDGQLGFKTSMDESCWTPLNVSFPYASDGLVAYTHSKTLSEKELLKHINGDDKLEIVSLVCGVVGGDTTLPTMPESMAMLVSQIANNNRYHVLRFIEELSGKVPILHIEDVCEAHMFCIEKPSMNGRFLCASEYLSSAQIASHWKKFHPDTDIAEELVEDLGREIVWGSIKLEEIGFEYKYDAKMILDESLICAKRMSHFNLIN